MRGATNMLVIVLDALRGDAVAPTFEEPGRCFKAQTCITTAPWTLPSCTSLITGLNPARHRHFWHSSPLAASDLVRRIPSRFRKVGLVNNTALQASSQLDAGFDQWVYFAPHHQSFDQAEKLIREARPPRKPLFLVLHSNIAHDFYLPGASEYFDETFPDERGGACILGERVIKWADTTSLERAAVAKTYAGSARKAVSCARRILDLVRARDDFVSVVVADHGEGLEYDRARVHHGGRLHDDLLRIPLYFDLPSKVPDHQRNALAAALASAPVAITDVLPTLFALAGLKPVPGIDGQRIDTVSPERIVVSEDRRYFYFNDRFRMNYKGKSKNMSPQDRVDNERLQAQLAGPPLLRSYRSQAAKLIATCLHLRPEARTPSDSRRVLLGFGERLMGSPLLVLRGKFLVRVRTL